MMSETDKDDFLEALLTDRYVIPTDIDADSYIAELRNNDRGQEVLSEIQEMFKDDKGWDSEEEMIKDMANFRRKRMGL